MSRYCGWMSKSESEHPNPSPLKENGNGTGEEETRGRPRPAGKEAPSKRDPRGVGEMEFRWQLPTDIIFVREEDAD